MTTRVLTRFSADLARWPSFWPHVTQFRTCPRNHQDKYFEQDSWLFINETARVLTRFSADLARWPSFWTHETQFRTWPRNHQDKHFEQDSWLFINVTARELTRFSGVLVFDPKWPSVELDLELIKTNILSTNHDHCLKDVTARVLTRFSFDLAWWPSFWPQVTQFQAWPRNHQGKHFEQYLWWLFQKSDL